MRYNIKPFSEVRIQFVKNKLTLVKDRINILNRFKILIKRCDAICDVKDWNQFVENFSWHQLLSLFDSVETNGAVDPEVDVAFSFFGVF